MDLKWYERLSSIPAWLRLVIFTYVLWLLILYVMQDGLLFYPELAGPVSATAPYLGAEKLTTTWRGEEVYGYFIPASGPTPAPLAVVWHGNAELVDNQSFFVYAYLARGFAVLLPEYPGYGLCGGKPSQKSIVTTSVQLLDQATGRPDVDGQRLLYHGRSLGGAVAAQVALQRPPRALILQSAPANIGRLAHSYGAPAFLARSPFATDRAIEQITAPLLLIHGRTDAVIPFAQARYLASLKPGARFEEFPCGHNDLPPSGLVDAYWSSIDGLLHEAGLAAPVIERPRLLP